MPLVACPDCYRQISDVAPACIGCGRPMTSLLSHPPTGVTVVTTPPPARSAVPMVVGIGAIALAVGAVIFAWNAWTPSAGRAAAASPQTADAAIRLGEVGVLHSLDGLPTVMLFESRDDFEAADKANQAKDDAAYKQLVRSRATFVPAGTHAREVEAVFQGGVRVQLVDGPRPGFAGWTFTETLQRE